MGHLYYIVSSQGLQPTTEDWKSQRSGRTMTKVSSGSDKTSVLMNPQFLWLPAQEPHKVKPIGIPAQRWEGLKNLKP